MVENVCRGGKSLPGEACDVFEHGGLVFFDREDIIGLFVFGDEPGRFRLGMHGIGDHDLTGDLHRGEKSAEFGDLVGLFVHVLLGNDDPPVLEEGGEEVGLLTSLGLGGSPDRLSVDGEDLHLARQS